MRNVVGQVIQVKCKSSKTVFVLEGEWKGWIGAVCMVLYILEGEKRGWEAGDEEGDAPGLYGRPSSYSARTPITAPDFPPPRLLGTTTPPSRVSTHILATHHFSLYFSFSRASAGSSVNVSTGWFRTASGFYRGPGPATVPSIPHVLLGQWLSAACVRRSMALASRAPACSLPSSYFRSFSSRRLVLVGRVLAAGGTGRWGGGAPAQSMFRGVVGRHPCMQNLLLASCKVESPSIICDPEAKSRHEDPLPLAGSRRIPACCSTNEAVPPKRYVAATMYIRCIHSAKLWFLDTYKRLKGLLIPCW